MKILLTIPTWNEAVVIRKTLESVVQRMRQLFPTDQVIIEVADNASTDDTRKIVQQMREVELFCLAEKGKGLAIRRSWERHVGDADVLMFTDADLAADLMSLPAFVQEIVNGKADIVCGSRYAKGAIVERGLVRELASRLYRLLQHVVLGLPVQDAQCGLKAISAQVAKILLPHCQETGWMFDSELLFQAKKQGFRIQEIPVFWKETRDADRRSALKLWRDGWEFLLKLFEILVRR